MRLTEKELTTIKKIFYQYFNENDHLWLFGSRASDLKRGGDIDFYIETLFSNKDIVLASKLNFIVELKKQIGDQKIDVVVNILSDNQPLPIYDKPKKTGIQII